MLADDNEEEEEEEEDDDDDDSSNIFKSDTLGKDSCVTCNTFYVRYVQLSLLNFA